MRGKIRAMTLPNILTITKPSGRVFRYVRIKGKPLAPLPDLPVTDPAFLAAYAAAMSAMPKRTRAAPGTVVALIEAYLRSEAHKALSPVYRATIRREIEAIREQAEDALARHLKPAHITADISPLQVNKANARLKAWRCLCAYGFSAGLLQFDPSDGVKRKKPVKTDGHVPWSDDEIEKYRRRWPIGSVPRAAMELLFWTGARVSDAVLIGPQMVGRDGVLAFRQAKTKGFAFVPWTCAVPAYACEADRDLMHEALKCLSGQLTFLAARGRTRSHKALSTVIADSAKEAGIVGKSAHGLRKARAVALAEGGASSLQIGAWTGHHSLSEIEHYTRGFSRRSAVIGTEPDHIIANHADPTVQTG